MVRATRKISYEYVTGRRLAMRCVLPRKRSPAFINSLCGSGAFCGQFYRRRAYYPLGPIAQYHFLMDAFFIVLIIALYGVSHFLVRAVARLGRV